MGAFTGYAFRGARLVIPGVYPYIDASALVPSALGSIKRLAIVGTAKGGTPRTPLAFNSPQDARSVLLGGPLFTAIQLAYAPSPEVAGAQEVLAYRLNLATRGLYTWDNKIIFTSLQYGEAADQIALKIETGSQSGKRVTIYDPSVPLLETKDNLGRLCAMEYTGAGSAALLYVGPLTDPGSAPGVAAVSGGALDPGDYDVKITSVDDFGGETAPTPVAHVTTTDSLHRIAVTIPALAVGQVKANIYVAPTGGTLKLIGFATASGTFNIDALPVPTAETPPVISNSVFALRTRVTGGGAGEDLNLNLTLQAYAELQTLVEFLDGQQAYTASMLTSLTSIPPTELDPVPGQDIKTATYNLLSDIGEIVFWVNSLSTLVSAVRQAGATGSPANGGFVTLSGGNEGPAPTLEDWQNAADALSMEDVQAILVLSDVQAVHDMFKDHVEFESEIKQRRYRVLFCGGAPNEGLDLVSQRALALVSKRVSLAYPGIKKRNLVTGAMDDLSSVYHAALLAGMWCGAAPGDPITNKEISVEGLERGFSQSEMERLLRGGVAISAFDHSDQTFRVVQGLTTWQRDANVIWRKLAGIDVHDTLAREMIAALKPFIGTKATKDQVQVIFNAVESKLNTLIATTQNPDGIITPVVDAQGKARPAYENLVVNFDGLEVVAVSFQAHPTLEIDYITISISLQPSQIVVRG